MAREDQNWRQGAPGSTTKGRKGSMQRMLDKLLNWFRDNSREPLIDSYDTKKTLVDGHKHTKTSMDNYNARQSPA